MQKQFTGIRIENDMLEKIDKIAEKNGRSRSNLIRFIIQKYVESHENI
ncbi:hypothetical protein [Microvirus mar32]|uniref:Ribbon-helix-helix protein CopG domain-containing protein n=1 Tax=Microvirus mar32 TaxID=2851166 RepID=A0A8F5ML28_9VIRU|nr:hypothetical protein [Microvirus mar32]